MLQATLGACQLLAHPGDRRLHLIGPVDGVLWDLALAGWSPAAQAGVLAMHFGIGAAQAQAHVDASHLLWRQCGLLDTTAGAVRGDDWQLDRSDDPVWPAPRPRALPSGARRVVVADRHIAIRCADPALAYRFDGLLGDEPAPSSAGSMTRAGVDHTLTLRGPASAWRLWLDGATVQTGRTGDAALVAMLSTLTELGCRPAERLIVVHGAGVITADGRGLLLAAPGGSGKTTLAAALDAAGCGLLSDDVVPVALSGELLGLGLPLCLKPGSWPVLKDRLPGLMDSPPVQRLGQTVRFLPPRNRAAGAAVRAAALLLSRYAPGEPPGHERISPEQALQGLVEAEAVLRQLTQRKIEALAQWLGAVPAYRLNYPDLDSGLRLVRELVSACGRLDGPPRQPAAAARRSGA